MHHRTTTKCLWLGILTSTSILLLSLAGEAHAVTITGMNKNSTIRIHNYLYPGHATRVVSWRPGDPHSRVLVQTGTHTPAHTGNTHRRALAVLSGGTWNIFTGKPTGLVVTHGVEVARGDLDYPAVGFLRDGTEVYGARAALHAGAANILSGMAYLVRGGKMLRTYPWTTPTQHTCGAKGTDGPGGKGCWRSIVARLANGRDALIEIRYASMLQAAKILIRLHVVDAITGDSGGSAALWTRFGEKHCPFQLYGTCWQQSSFYERPVADAVELNYLP